MENNKEIDKKDLDLTAKQPEKLEKEEKINKIRKLYTNPNNFFSDKDKFSEYYDLSKNSKDLTGKKEKRSREIEHEISIQYGLENGLWVSNVAHKQYVSALAQMRRNIVKDYNCQSSLELMLADRIVANYWRTMRNDTLLNHYMENENGSFSVNQLRINMIREFDRSLERADRQMNADIILLKELKQPQLNIKVTTENTYIAQNQVNVDNKNNEAK